MSLSGVTEVEAPFLKWLMSRAGCLKPQKLGTQKWDGGKLKRRNILLVG
jgi:hypothetical protein